MFAWTIAHFISPLFSIQRIEFRFQELNLTEVNDEGDSSDSENENDANESSDDELSFESDDEGNFQQNLNKKHSLVNESDSDEFNVDDDEDDQDDSEGGEDEELSDEAEVSGESDVDDDPESAYISDDSDELSFEEDDSDGGENVPSVSGNNKSKKPPKTVDASKQNGKVSSKATTSNGAKSNSTEKPSKASNKTNKQPTNAVDAFKTELKQSGSSTNKGDDGVDEYKFDTDDEEDIRNTVGNIPMKWYDEYKHIGYDWDAKKIIKPPKRDQLDDFLKRMEDPNFWRTVKDPQTGQDVILSEADIDLIKRINSRRVPDANFDDYAVSIRFLYRSIVHLSLKYFTPHFTL